jgi:hypothetical protein
VNDFFQAFDPNRYWYSLVAASPAPETGESVNVAVLFGNGQAVHLAYRDHLPRLCGIAAADEINVYEAVLSSVAKRVGQGLDVATVAGMLAPQMFLKAPRLLLQDLSDSLIETIRDRYLTTPQGPPASLNVDALVRKSVARLDRTINELKPTGVIVQRNVRPSTLFEGKLDRFVPFTVPKLARAFRGFGRDVLIDSLEVDDLQATANVRVAAARIGQAFFAYDQKLRPLVRDYAGREFRTLGILHPANAEESANTLELREYIKDSWAQHATVVDGTHEDILRELRAQADWILEVA